MNKLYGDDEKMMRMMLVIFVLKENEVMVVLVDVWPAAPKREEGEEM